MSIALVCIAKNEDHYIQEWVDYHLKIGFDSIFVYQNDWRYQIDNAICIPFDGPTKQLAAYDHFVANNWANYTWGAFWDVDEFLVLKKHKTVADFVQEYSEHPAIGINWAMFGDNGLASVTDEYSVIKRFTRRQASINANVKSLVKLSASTKMGVHVPQNTWWVDTNENRFTGPFNDVGLCDVAQLNHYWCKTRGEFYEKCARGRADSVRPRTPSEFSGHTFAAGTGKIRSKMRRLIREFKAVPIDFNAVEDLAAYKFYFG